MAYFVAQGYETRQLKEAAAAAAVGKSDETEEEENEQNQDGFGAADLHELLGLDIPRQETFRTHKKAGVAAISSLRPQGRHAMYASAFRMGEAKIRGGRRWFMRLGSLVALVYGLLLLPEGMPPRIESTGKTPFIWNRDQFWAGLERDFVQARSAEKSTLNTRIAEKLTECERCLAAITKPDVLDPNWTRLETNLFQLAPLVAAEPARLSDFVRVAEAARSAVKRHSVHWDLSAAPARERLYTLLSGSRLAVEEVLLQNPQAAASLPAPQEAEPSPTSVVVRGVRLHSGDILISRGNAPTSALIARGNDYPGAFSHVSLLHVDAITGKAQIIQSLIEHGVVVTPLEDYFGDHKLRIMVLRVRADLPAFQKNPRLPHEAATRSLEEALTKPAPYDFSMDYRDHSKLFCSEVVAAAYEAQGVRLWMGMSYISSPTVAAWLSSVGVRHFETQEPADLEYDPQLLVIAEWRDPAALWQAHLDDAVTDVMLESAEPGRPLPFNRLMLPLARLGKLYSVIVNQFGLSGPIPRGMSASAALRMDRYRAEHAALKQRLAVLAARFQETHDYSPPYWELIRLAKEAQKSGG